MKLVQLEEREIKELILFYENQLTLFEQKKESILAILDRITSDETSVSANKDAREEKLTDKEPLVQKKRGRKRISPEPQKPEFVHSTNTIKKEEAEPTKKIAKFDVEKFNWRHFIVEFIRRSKKFISTSTLTEITLNQFELDESYRNRISRKIHSNLLHLVRKNYIKTQRVIGDQNAYYGLPEWYDEQEKPYKSYLGDLQIKTSRGLQKTEKDITKQDVTLEKKSIPENEMTEAFIMDAMHEKNQILIVEDFLDMAKIKFDFKPLQRRLIKEEINEYLHKLHKNKEIIRIRIKNSGDYQYALPEWITADGKLKEGYAVRF